MDSPYALHLAVAAASAYYMHRKTLDQLLRFARSVDRDQRRRNHLLSDGEEDEHPPPRDHDRRTLPIPPGLPPLHTGREGKPIISSASSKRVGSLVRPTTPKCPVPTVSAFETIGDSDEDDALAPDSKNDAAWAQMELLSSGWIWWMMKANQKGAQQSTCRHLSNGLMFSIQLMHIMCTIVMLTCAHSTSFVSPKA